MVNGHLPCDCFRALTFETLTVPTTEDAKKLLPECRRFDYAKRPLRTRWFTHRLSMHQRVDASVPNQGHFRSGSLKTAPLASGVAIRLLAAYLQAKEQAVPAPCRQKGA
mmetsp:Transcript_46314/g.114874  ORF Transcript_46314/g.114874 Transcript_46314/m.114874 type:complete len:109 (-) Transcript_46314:265-591(-)